MGVTTREIGRQAEAAKDTAAPWIEALARLGYATKGLVYGIIGILTIQAAYGLRSAKVDQQEVFKNVLGQPFGVFLLGLMALGMVGYAVWRIVQATFDPEHEGKKSKGWIKRLSYAVTAIGYLVLAAAAVKIALGAGGGEGPQDFTATLLGHPLGRYVVALVGLIVLGVGVSQVVQAYKKKFERNFKFGEMGATLRKWVLRLGQIGYAAKGLVVGIVGLFLLRAAWMYDPGQAGGLGEAFVAVGTQPYGRVLLAVVAVGFLAYGLYAFLLAHYRRVVVA